MNQNNTSKQNTADCSINIKDFENHYFNVKKYFENKEAYALCIDFGKQYYVDSVKLDEYEIFTLDTFKNLDDIKENYDILEKNIVKPYDKYCYNNKYLFLIEEEIKEKIFIRYKESINSDYVIEYFKEYNDKSDSVYYIELVEESKRDIEKDNLAEFFKDDAPVYITSKQHKKLTPLTINFSDAKRNVLCISANEKPSKICVKYNTYQLDNYIKGIKSITDITKKESFTIFDIFQLIRGKNVITPYQIENIKWEILKDDTRKGCKEQRDFVIKALNTEDICVLEGPPGSGKTTCISELILQILKNNPRAKILLMASTHVAVDNVLERLVDSNLPAVRLGVEDRIADNMKAYKYPEVINTEYDKFMHHHKDKDIEKYFNLVIGKAEFERLIRKTTNIVCCTTNGIHKYIKQNDPIITTDFDYLILDEASKTTIAEFLAVARYAKKWILTGDIKQLSPYTDADELSVSIKKDILYDIGTSILGVAAYKNKDNQKLIEEKVYPIISKALLCNIIKDFDKEDLVHISIPDNFSNDLKLSFKMCDYIDKNINSNALVYNEYYIYQEAYKAILENFADIVISTDIFYKKNRKNFYKDPYNKIKYRIWNKHFCNSRSGKTKEEKDIADAISWRLIRDYELRQLKDNEQLKNKYVNKYISEAKKLMPKNIQNKIMARQYVVTQSILELTQNTLQEMGNKFQSLTYQHRMPDNLAELPRNIIYHSNNMLSNDDNSYVDNTKWYHIVSNRAVTENDDECKCIIDDIKDIVSSKPNKKVEIAILTFYRAQEWLIQKALKSEYGKKNYIEKNNVFIRVATVDRFQGQEADIVMISLSRNAGSGFLNSPNRINVAMTRARKIRYMYGNHKFFLNNDNLEIMQAVAKWYKDKKLVEIRLDKKGDK